MGGVLIPRIAVVLSPLTFALLQGRDVARRGFTDQVVTLHPWRWDVANIRFRGLFGKSMMSDEQEIAKRLRRGNRRFGEAEVKPEGSNQRN